MIVVILSLTKFTSKISCHNQSSGYKNNNNYENFKEATP